MRKSAVGVLAVGVGAALLITACSSSSKTSTTSTASAGTSGSGSSSSGAVDYNNASSVDGKGAKVGIILPDTTSSPRWVTADPDALKAACSAAKLTCDIQNANGDQSKQKAIAEQMETNGDKVLMVVNLSPASGAAIEQEATKKGVSVIDYDRLTPGGGAALYVSFDNTKVGQLQGQTLTQCSEVKGKSAVKYVEIDGAPTDNNATLFKNGYQSVLSKTPGWSLVSEQTGQWDASVARTVFTSMLQKNKDITAVMVANDTMAGAVETVIQNQGLTGKIAVSGQDASAAGLQAIMTGQQCFTIYKPSTGEAVPAVVAAAQLANGQIPTTTATTTDPSTNKPVPSLLSTPVAITQANVAEPINANYTPKSTVCTGTYVSLCTKFGVK